MRRFVDTFAGKALCHLAAMALVLPTVTLTVAGRAEAQVQQLPSWAVTEFRDLKSGNRKYGQAAADAVSGELAKTNRYDIVAQDTVNRAIETLGLTSPLEGLVNLSRVGTEALGAASADRGGTIVSGEVVDYRVDNVGGGKQARVALRVVAYDVASVLPVNGALEEGQSTVRGGNVSDETLVTDAIQQAAAIVVRTMQGQQLPSATILNTQTRTALLNQGTRSGFKTGDSVIITRGPIQVGTGRIGVIEPDQAEISYERVRVGVAPGDRVRAVFTPPALPAAGVSILKANGGLRVSSRPKGRSNNATLISALLVVGLVGVLLGGGNGSATDAATVTAEATTDIQTNTAAAVRVKWTRNGFFKGNANTGTGTVRWQVYRSDVSLNPILVVDNAQQVVDSTRRTPSNDTGYLRDPIAGGTTCKNTSPTNATIPTTTPVLVAGQTYVYSLEAVYSVTGLDLPSGGTSGGTGTTNTGTTNGTTNTGTTNGTTNTGTTTSGTTGTTTTATGTTNTGTTTSAGSTSTTGTNSGSGDQLCYFRSGRSSSGRVTPLERPTVTQPAANATLGDNAPPFTIAAPNVGGQLVQYVFEFSDDPSFPKSTTVRTPVQNTVSFNIDVVGGSLFTTRLRNAQTIYYRAGIRVQSDRPGPVAENGDKNRRFIYSLPRSFSRSPTFPGTP